METRLVAAASPAMRFEKRLFILSLLLLVFGAMETSCNTVRRQHQWHRIEVVI
jgi:hypothetical protein